MNKTIRLLIADESPVYRKMFARAILEIAENVVTAYAVNPDEILDKIRQKDYDIIVLDADISKLGISEFLPAVTREIPKAIILISARPSSINDKRFAEVLAKGAFDCMVKPIYGSYSENFSVVKSKLEAVLKVLYERRREKRKQHELRTQKTTPFASKQRFHPEIVLFAASTGGPQALEKILPALNKSFPVPILVIQHMLPHFTESLTQTLNNKSKLRIKIAEHKEMISAGTVYIAPDELHMRLNAQKQLLLVDSPPVNGVKPAADILFESVADAPPWTGVLTIILTGMGRDGQKGLARLKEKQRCYCLAQSEKTCVVYGMPRSVVETGLADMILDLDDIAQEIENFFPSTKTEKS